MHCGLVVEGCDLLFAYSFHYLHTSARSLALGFDEAQMRPGRTVLLSPPHLVFADIAHKLRLQFLRAKFSAHVQRAFLLRELFIPRGEV